MAQVSPVEAFPAGEWEVVVEGVGRYFKFKDKKKRLQELMSKKSIVVATTAVLRSQPRSTLFTRLQALTLLRGLVSPMR